MATQVWLSTANGNAGTSGNWSNGPVAAGDDIYFPAGTPAVTAGLTALNTATLSGALGKVVFEPGYSGAVGSAAGYFQFTCTSFQFNGTGTAYIDLQASAIAPQINTTGSPQVGYMGLYLIGSALTTVNVAGGTVGLAFNPGETATATAVSLQGSAANVTIGAGVTLTTLNVYVGTAALNCAATTVNANGGNVYTAGSGAVTTLNNNGANVYANSTGTISTLNANAGSTSFLTSGIARTVSSLKLAGGSVAYDPAVVTVSAFASPGKPIRLSSAATAT